MNIEPLIRMADQIGEFFDAMPDREEALEGIAQHIKRFWEPRMRLALLAHIEAHGTAGLTDIVAEALARHQPLLTPVGSPRADGTSSLPKLP